MLNAGLRVWAAGAIMLPALNWALPAAAAELELAPPAATERAVVAKPFTAPRVRIANHQYTSHELIRVAVRDDLRPLGCILCTGVVLGVGF
jgi:hypothetical protein